MEREVIPLEIAEALQRLHPVQWGDLKSLPKREYLIKRGLDKGGLSVTYGESNSGKSFFALDLSLSLARGIQWRDRRTRQCPVVYIAAEGGLGLVERLTAYQYRHEVDPHNIPFHLVAATVDLCGTNDADIIMKAMEGIGPGLIVVDTLAAAFGGGNENSPDDMNRFLQNVQRLRLATGAHCLVVHHTGKDIARGARGHSSLRAATDTEIEVVADSEGNRSATVTKQRDGATGDEFHFRLDVVDIGQDEDGDWLTSCVIVEAEDGPGRNRRKRPALTPQQRRAMECLETCIIDHGTYPPDMRNYPPGKNVVSLDLWRTEMGKWGVLSADNPDTASRQWRRIKADLTDKGKIAEYNGFVWIITPTG